MSFNVRSRLRTRNAREIYATGRRATRASGAECAPARRGVAIGYSSAAAPLRVTGLLPRPRFPAPRGGGAGPGTRARAATGPGAAFGRFPVPFGGVAVPGDALPQSRQFHALPLGNFLIGFGFAGLAGRLRRCSTRRSPRHTGTACAQWTAQVYTRVVENTRVETPPHR